MTTKFPGVPVFLNGEVHLVPSLSLRQVEENYDLLTKPFEVTDTNLREHFSTFIPVIGMAIRRNYPDVTDDNLRDWVGLSNFYTLLAVVKGVSGIKEADPGE